MAPTTAGGRPREKIRQGIKANWIKAGQSGLDKILFSPAMRTTEVRQSEVETASGTPKSARTPHIG